MNNSCNAKSRNTYFGQWNTEDSPSTGCKFVHILSYVEVLEAIFLLLCIQIIALIYSFSCEVLRKINCQFCNNICIPVLVGLNTDDPKHATPGNA